MPGLAERTERPDDENLVAALRAGDERAFNALVDSWSGSMFRVARGYVPTDSLAEDVVQETWLAVVRGLAGFRGASSFRTWVYRIVVNQAKTRGARERRTIPLASVDGVSSPDPPEDRPEQTALAHEVLDVVANALSTLPPRQRAVVALRDVHGHSSDEVSDLLEISTGNQRVLLHRGRTVVRAHLERYFLEPVIGTGS